MESVRNNISNSVCSRDLKAGEQEGKAIIASNRLDGSTGGRGKYSGGIVGPV